MTYSNLEKLEQRIKTADDYSQVNDAFNDATQFEHTANSIEEAAELLGVDASDIHDRIIIEEELFLSDAFHMIGGNSYCACQCTVMVFELYADPGSDDYVYMLEVKF